MDWLGLRTLPFLTRRNYFYEFRHLIAWSVLAGLIEGQFASVIVSKSFHGSPLLISVATSTPVAALMFSLIWGMLCIGRPKVRLATMFAAGMVVCAGFVSIIPTSSVGTLWFIIQIAAAQILLAGVVTVRSAIWKSNYPRTVRGRITARLQAVRFLVSVVTVLASAAICDRDPLAFHYLYPAAAVVGVVGILLLQRLHIRGESQELRRRQPLGDGDLRAGMVEPFSITALLSPGRVLGQMVRVLRRDRLFRRYCLAQILTGVSNLMTLSLVVVIITRDLHLGFRWEFWISTGLIVSLPRLVMLGSLGRWGRLFDRVGVVRFRVVNITCWTASLLFGLAASSVVEYADPSEPAAFLTGIGLFVLRAIFQGVGYGGGALAWNLGHLHFAKPEEAEIYMGIHVSLTGLRGVVAPLGGMLLWKYAGFPLWIVWLIAIALSLGSLAVFLAMAKQEKRVGMPRAPGDAPQ